MHVCGFAAPASLNDSAGTTIGEHKRYFVAAAKQSNDETFAGVLASSAVGAQVSEHVHFVEYSRTSSVHRSRLSRPSSLRY